MFQFSVNTLVNLLWLQKQSYIATILQTFNEKNLKHKSLLNVPFNGILLFYSINFTYISDEYLQMKKPNLLLSI